MSKNEVAIIGAGYMGCLMINVARIRGASKVVVIDKDQNKLKYSEFSNLCVEKFLSVGISLFKFPLTL